jgi:hypothetical protein
MAKTPGLIITYDKHLFPASADCSDCGEEMPQGEPRIAASDDNIRWFSSHFADHLLRKHLRGNVK